MHSPYLMIVFQVIEPAMKNKWLSVMMFGWVTELPVTSELTLTWTVGVILITTLLLDMQLPIYNYELKFRTLTVPLVTVKSNSYMYY